MTYPLAIGSWYCGRGYSLAGSRNGATIYQVILGRFVAQCSGQDKGYISIEAAPVALFEADNTHLSFGVRIGGAFAFTALRRRNVLPWAGLAMSYEYYFDGGGRGPIQFFRAGLRIGLPWDP